jgi:murein DD-endopeptidase MepM/ murein hydrolase activator NlpD
MKTTIVSLIFLSFFFSCKKELSDNIQPQLVDKKYVLPYPVGKAYTCTQGFNTSPSHTGTFSNSVDFGMPIGTPVTVARGGHVVYIIENYLDNDQIGGHENVVIIMHEDSTYARYVHLTLNGALVELNQIVVPGDTIGLSGSSGTDGGPHLHFDITKTFAGKSDQTIPFDFMNIISHPIGLQRGVIYEALPY